MGDSAERVSLIISSDWQHHEEAQEGADWDGAEAAWKGHRSVGETQDHLHQPLLRRWERFVCNKLFTICVFYV